MSDMKCPFCQQELDIGGVDGILRGCPKCRNLGTEMLWQELIRTHKALEWARHFLKEIRSLFLLEKDNPARQNKWVDTAIRMWGWAEDALTEITALEQKERK